ncbi:histidine phosphatase family protein [Nocardioides jishulii]|uniref:Histidine phosphatase family protein n=1 Tax=Nocardioides jishulii TaxID=2575440 RepID=A0A4U2YHX3_9ACTN|nr:histidine phosphatase family protein [Nocardioides jishulii]QCX28013.1 histidine phosphatase family protein [Nocardioides jishulii]TKI60677.1 histidine phosphatase family protein [Nocardioides jishulii]
MPEGAEPRRLLLLRHGQTAWNLERRIQGQTDVPLDDTGIEQAEAVAPVIAAMHPAFVRSSDLARARTTAEKVADAAGVDVKTDPRLREFDLGERAGLTHGEYASVNADEFAAFRAGRYEAAPGAESREQVEARFVPALEDALADLAPGELGVVVAHGAALKVALVAWLGWAPEAVLSLQALGNCHWVLVEAAGLDEVDQTSRGRRLVGYNRHA